MNPFFNNVVYSNLMPFILLVIFFILVLYNPAFNKRQERLFLVISIIIASMLLAISIDYLISTRDNFLYLWPLRSFTTFLNFAISPTIPLLLYKISENNKSPSKWFYTPFAINFVLCIFSIPTHLIFGIDNTNSYIRGPMFLLPFITTLIYILVIMIKSSKNKVRGRHFERIFLFGFVLLLLISLTLEVRFYFQFLTWTCASISIPLYYILLNINCSILDPLTSCYNRLMYNKDLDRLQSFGHGVIALLDINDFKYINDTYGHDVGDQFLIKFANTVSASLPTFAGLYRIGGDEFIVISRKDELEKITDSINKARDKLYHDTLYFSYGISRYTANQDIQELLNDIDKKMYKNKKDDKISHPIKKPE